jgi:hypothetical protein
MWADDEVKFYSPDGNESSVKFKTVVSEERDEASGKLVRVTRELKVTSRRLKTKTNRHVRRRRELPKFGACADSGPGPDHCTSVDCNVVDCNVVELDLGPNPKPAAAAAAAVDLLVVCQLCKEPGHWTLKCPKRSQGDGPRTMPGERRPKDEFAHFSVCINNVPPHMQDLDVLDLCPRSFRRHVVRSRDADAEALRAFVDFRNQEDADAAVTRLNGLLYGNMVLSVERAKPRKNKAS